MSEKKYKLEIQKHVLTLQDGFVIEIEARESKTGHLAKATVYLWVFEPDQLIKLTIEKPPMEANLKKDVILTELRNATKQIIVLDDIRYNKLLLINIEKY